LRAVSIAQLMPFCWRLNAGLAGANDGRERRLIQLEFPRKRH
jgi:hypothetical protein